jgi:hypothetical protein
LVQIDEYKKSDNIFNSEYVYFSSFSKSWLKHAHNYCEMMTSRFQLNKSSQVIELASNDGYLLQYFKQLGIPVLGIEPTSNTATVAIEKGVDTIVDFFGTRLARDLAQQNKFADVLLGNNVVAHVPDIIDFVAGMKIILKKGGVITMEFPHLMKLVDNNQFDTIYHEHFSYLSFGTVKQIFESQQLELFDVEELPTHGGSLRIFAKHQSDAAHSVTANVTRLLQTEKQKGLDTLSYYKSFSSRAADIKLDMISFLIDQKRANKKVAAYGAAAKGNTLLNYCGIKNDLISYVVDANPNKRQKYLPGSHVPVVNEEMLRQHKPDFVIIFPWNLQEEITAQLSYIREWGGKFVVPIPQFRLI